MGLQTKIYNTHKMKKTLGSFSVAMVEKRPPTPVGRTGTMVGLQSEYPTGVTRLF